MDFKQLDAFINVVKHKSFSRAAEIMNVSQPSISSYISSLEKELETLLLFRSTKDVSITREGRILYDYAVTIINLRNNAIYEVQKINKSPEGEIDILASSVPAQYILPKIIPKFSNSYPNITYKVKQSQSYNIISDITNKKSDFGVVGSIIEEPECNFQHFLTDKLVVIMPYSMKYINMEITDVKSFFLSEKFIMREENSGTHREYMKFFNSIGLNLRDLNTVAVLNNTQAVISSVISGLGISIVSELAAEYYISQKLLYPLKHDSINIERGFYFVYNKDIELSFMSKSFIEFAINACKKNLT